MSTNKKHVGYIFQHEDGNYYLEFKRGATDLRQFAHVYTVVEAQRLAQLCPGWGGKQDGKWIAVYE